MISRDTRLPPYPIKLAIGAIHIATICVALTSYDRSTRTAVVIAEKLGDAGTADLLTGILRQVDQILWKTGAHLEAPTSGLVGR